MEEDVASAFQRLESKIDNLPCSERGERLARLEQSKENGHIKKSESFDLWKVIIPAIGLAIIILQVMGLVK